MKLFSGLMILAAATALTLLPARAEPQRDDGGFGRSFFTEQAPAALADTLTAEDMAKALSDTEPAAGDEKPAAPADTGTGTGDEEPDALPAATSGTIE